MLTTDLIPGICVTKLLPGSHFGFSLHRSIAETGSGSICGPSSYVQCSLMSVDDVGLTSMLRSPLLLLLPSSAGYTLHCAPTVCTCCPLRGFIAHFLCYLLSERLCVCQFVWDRVYHSVPLLREAAIHVCVRSTERHTWQKLALASGSHLERHVF